MTQMGLTAFAVDQRLARLPVWLLDRDPKIVEQKDRVRLKWHGTCRDHLCHIDCHHRGKMRPTDEEVATQWA